VSNSKRSFSLCLGLSRCCELGLVGVSYSYVRAFMEDVGVLIFNLGGVGYG